MGTGMDPRIEGRRRQHAHIGRRRHGHHGELRQGAGAVLGADGVVVGVGVRRQRVLAVDHPCADLLAAVQKWHRDGETDEGDREQDRDRASWHSRF